MEIKDIKVTRNITSPPEGSLPWLKEEFGEFSITVTNDGQEIAAYIMENGEPFLRLAGRPKQEHPEDLRYIITTFGEDLQLYKRRREYCHDTDVILTTAAQKWFEEIIQLGANELARVYLEADRVQSDPREGVRFLEKE